MSAIVSAFKIKPFDLEPIYTDWKNPPIFSGTPKRDPSVDIWLAEIKAGCMERKVPKGYWHTVAQHYLGPQAKSRFDELKVVLAKIHGGKYHWNWKKFKIAMINMGWDIDPNKTEAIKVATRPSGLWWIIGKGGDASQSTTSDKDKKSTSASSSKALLPTSDKKASTSSRSSSQPVSSVESTTLSGTTGGTSTVFKQVPTWLVNACEALEFLTIDHPQTMSALSAILITVGSLPAIPALAGGAGGVVLASHAAQAVGAVAVGLGNWLKVAQENAQRKMENPPNA